MAADDLETIQITLDSVEGKIMFLTSERGEQRKEDVTKERAVFILIVTS